MTRTDSPRRAGGGSRGWPARGGGGPGGGGAARGSRSRVHEDGKKQRFFARVLAVEGTGVVLDQTFFYPEGGGQEADHGTIRGYDVVDVQQVGDSVVHFMKVVPSSLAA